MTTSPVRLQLDEILKLLFQSSSKMIIPFINDVFNETYDESKTTIRLSNTEFIQKHYSSSLLNLYRADVVLLITENNKTKAYHIEFQLKKDSEMAIRMFNYGFLQAKENHIKNNLKICLPKPLVIYFEKNLTIENELTLEIIFPDESIKYYHVPILKYWELSKEEMLYRQLYILLPLQLLNKRIKMEQAARIKNQRLLEELANEAIKIALQLHYEAEKLNKKQHILFSDYDKIVVAIDNLLSYLNKKYIKNKNMDVEAEKMRTTFIDPNIFNHALEQGLEQGLEKSIKLLYTFGVPKEEALVTISKEFDLEPKVIVERINTIYKK